MVSAGTVIKIALIGVTVALVAGATRGFAQAGGFQAPARIGAAAAGGLNVIAGSLEGLGSLFNQFTESILSIGGLITGGLPGAEETLTCDKCVVADFRGRHAEFCIACLSNRPAAPDDRQGGRNINVGASGRQGLPPQPMVVPIGRLGAREPREQRVFQAGAFRIL